MFVNPGPDDGTVPAASSPENRPALGFGFASIIVELAPDGILVTGDDGRILMANRRTEEMFGYDRDALVGAPIESLLPPQLRRVHQAHRAHYAAAPTPRRMDTGLELYGCNRDGTDFPVEVSLSPVATEHGVATVVIVRDVAPQRALERSRRERLAIDMHDNVIGHLSRSALTIASALGSNQLDDHTTAQLHEVVDELDAAIRAIRTTVFASLAPDPTPATPPDGCRTD